MECRDTQRLIDAWLDRELAADAIAELKSHLADCPTCRNEYGGLITLLQPSDPLPVPEGLRDRVVSAVSVPDGLRDRIVGAVNQRAESLQRRRLWWLRLFSPPAAGAVAASLLLILMAWFMLRPPEAPFKPELAGEGPAPIAAAPNPWVLSACAQASRLPGPGSAAAMMIQPMVMDSLTRQMSEATPVIRVRQPLAGDTCPPEPEIVLHRLPFVLSDIPNLGV